MVGNMVGKTWQVTWQVKHGKTRFTKHGKHGKH